MICSESKLDDEVKFITETLSNNGFPEDIVRSIIRDKIADFSKIKADSVQRCPVYLSLPWLGELRDRFASQISACVNKSYFSSNLRVVFHMRAVLTSGPKDVLPPPNIAVLWFILLGLFVVCNTLGEPSNVRIWELNSMYSLKHCKGTTLLSG